MRKSVIKRWLRWLTTLVGGAMGAGVAVVVIQGWRLLAASTELENLNPMVELALYATLTIIGLLLTYAFASRIIDVTTSLIRRFERKLDETPMLQVAAGATGLLIGMVIAALVTRLFSFGPRPVNMALSVVTYLVLAYLGISVCTKRWREFPLLFWGRRAERQRERATASGTPLPKVLDTSVIIDGRIFDICKTGFVEGPLRVPQFVLAELQHIADSSDVLRRNRGRRGLDVLQRMQKELDVELLIDETDFEDVDEVDVKILKLAQQIGGVVMTNDYNLNKVASVSGVKVLNLNELANAIKPAVLHGEEMMVQIVREGKEPGQGVGYLEDGTMIVVDNGRRYVGETVEVVVTTVLQTLAGRMIFTRLKSAG